MNRMRKNQWMRSAILAGLASISATPLLAQGEALPWLGDYKDAIEEAKRTGKPIFLEYRCEP
jgi:hypothetical protein